jgi:serine phosphatase RsbU (regulator of sigma subunit)
MLSVAPGRKRARLHLAGHPPPLLLAAGGAAELAAPVSPPPGIAHVEDWPVTEVTLGEAWTLLMYTDGLIEGRIGKGSERLGSEGLINLITNALRSAPAAGNGDPGGGAADARLLDEVIEHVRELNGGDLDDDLAILALGYSAPVGP